MRVKQNQIQKNYASNEYFLQTEGADGHTNHYTAHIEWYVDPNYLGIYIIAINYD